MKFRHAYYTWDWEQLTQYEGLGIHASSCLDQSFLSQCMSIGSSLNPEGKKKTGTVRDTAQFLLYSDQLGYVGAFVSPREDVSKKNRVNMLCHIFAALEKPEKTCLEDYLVDYAYHTEIEKDRALVTEEYIYQDKTKSEKYLDLIQKYDFDSKKMAVCLWHFYQTLFEMKSGMTIYIDRQKQPDVNQDRLIAREITWLLSCLCPQKEFEKNRWYKKLTYGVYTKENTSVINLHYTDDKEKAHDFDLYGDYQEIPDEISPLFLKMGELAVGASCSDGNLPYDHFQNFLDELRADGSDDTLRFTSLDISYEKWKLNRLEDYVLEETHLKGMLKELMRGSKNSAWYKELYYQAVKKADIQDKQMLRQLWNSIVMNQIASYEEMEEKQELHDISYSLLHNMYGVSKDYYEKALKSLPEEARQAVLDQFMKAEPEMMFEELEQITDRKLLEKYLNLYGSLCSLEYPDVVDSLLDVAAELYEEGDRQERHSLSELLLKEAKITALHEGWNQYLEDWLEGFDRDLDKFLEFIEKQGKNFEQRLVIKVYDIFVSYGDLATKVKEGFEPLWEAEDTFRKRYQSDIPPVKTQSFDHMKENLRIERKVNRMKDMNLSELLCEPLDDVPHEKCYHRWFLRANELLYQKTVFGGEIYTELSDEQFQMLLIYRASGWNLLDQNDVDNRTWKSYDEEWKEYDRIIKRSLDDSAFSRRFYYYTSTPDNGTEFWNALDIADYAEFYWHAENHPENAQILEQARDKSNRKREYMIWKMVYQGDSIIGVDKQEFLNKMEHTKEYFDCMYTTILKKRYITLNDLMNLCMILYSTFCYRSQKMDSEIKRVRQYKVVLENEAVRTALNRDEDVKAAKRRMGKYFVGILNELMTVNHFVDAINRENSVFSEWVETRKEWKRNFEKDETEEMKELNLRIEKTLQEEKWLLEELLKKMRVTMTEYERLMQQKEELCKKLEECEASLKTVKMQAEKEQEAAKKQKKQYISDSDLAGFRVDQQIISDANQQLRRFETMLDESVENKTVSMERFVKQMEVEEPDENEPFAVNEIDKTNMEETETIKKEDSFDRKSLGDELFT